MLYHSALNRFSQYQLLQLNTAKKLLTNRINCRKVKLLHWIRPIIHPCLQAQLCRRQHRAESRRIGQLVSRERPLRSGLRNRRHGHKLNLYAAFTYMQLLWRSQILSCLLEHLKMRIEVI